MEAGGGLSLSGKQGPLSRMNTQPYLTESESVLERDVKFVLWQIKPPSLTLPVPSFSKPESLLRARTDRTSEVQRASHTSPKLGPAQEAKASHPSSPTSILLRHSLHISLGPLGCFQEGDACLCSSAWKGRRGKDGLIWIFVVGGD